jgi:hypothetical protein
MANRVVVNFFEDCATLAQSSIRLFNDRLAKWIGMFPDGSRDIHFLLMFPKRSLSILHSGLGENATATNIHMYISAITALFKHSPGFTGGLPNRDSLHQQWLVQQAHNSAPIERKRDFHTPTDKQAEKGGASMTMLQICARRDTLLDGSIEKLLIGMYTYIPPVRADYFATQLVQYGGVQTADNAVLFGDNEKSRASLLLRDFKTSYTYKKIYHPVLPTELVKQIRISLVEFPRDYLFVNADGHPFTRNAFQMWANRTLSRCFGMQFTLTLFRHIYISSLGDGLSVEELDQISRHMGHSLSMQTKYIWTV